MHGAIEPGAEPLAESVAAKRLAPGHRAEQVGLLGEDPLLELDERRRRVDAELLGQLGAETAEDREGIGLPARAVVGGHQLASEHLAKRVLPAQCLDGRDDLLGVAARELCFDQELLGGQPELRQSLRLGIGPGLVGELGVRLTVPEREGGVQSLDGARRILPLERRAAGLDACLEVDDVDDQPRRVELVAR